MSRALRTALLGVLAGGLVACASDRLARNLDPQSREFYSQVRFIITSEESRTFLTLAPAERPAFIQDFWERRDPTPGTDTNEYKEEYYKRIKEATHLFSGGGAPGWLQDRGRVHITLGPPDFRETYPRGVTFYGVPTEIWWYGFFPIVFVDERWVDDYRIEPSSAGQIAAITQAQKEWNEPARKGQKTFLGGTAFGVGPECEATVEKAESGGAAIRVAVPYRNIWMKAAGSRLRADLDVAVKILDASGAEAWTFSKSWPVEVPESRRREILDEDFLITIEAPIAPGSYTLVLSLTNTADAGRTDIKKAFTI
jgi:GWxTD domain-containing protein